ncbi:MAG: hypothetical protein JO190_03670 [Candidatus Eremiobacteraeota bacterium]|nr:hypothetical protein [Candidatus Eremiobacteraeota bacterium]MBV8499311.1 hypothetical protein [Candidatus Eremiobacteraeota bacterium]
MRRLLGLTVTTASIALVLTSLGAAPSGARFLYQDVIATPNGAQQNVTASIVIAAQSGGAKITVTATGASPVSVTIAPGQGAPSPQGTPSPQRAQGMLILQRVALMLQVHRAYPVSSLVDVRIPVLAPGASAPLALPAQLTQSSHGTTTLTAIATTSTTATIDPEKAKIHGILPARRVAERIKNAMTPSHVTLPDKITASIHATIENGAIGKMSGQVVHELSAHGQTTALRETWSIKPQ